MTSWTRVTSALWRRNHLMADSAFTVKLMLIVFTQIVSYKSDTQQIPFIRKFEPVFYDHDRLREHHVTKRSDDELTFQFEAFGRTFTPVLRHDNTHLHPEIVIETSKGTSIYNRPLSYSGTIKEDLSRVYGVLTKGGHFEGKIITSDVTYFIERAAHHFREETDFHTIVYKNSDVMFNFSHTSCAHAQLKEKQKKMTENENVHGINIPDNVTEYKTLMGDSMENYTKDMNIINTEIVKEKKKKRKKRAVDPTKTICELYMQADHKYFEKYGSDVDTVIEKLTQHVQAVDAMYKEINFDGSGGADSFGFIIKKIKVWDDPQVAGYKYDGNFAVDYFLDLHSQVDAQDNYDAFCLSYLFTYRDFSDGVLGLAWVGHLTSAGGVCEKFRTYQGQGKSLNTGIVTLLNYGSDVPSAVLQVTFAHEIGHNFGSEHDPDGDTDCTPGDPTGNYIMYARATSGSQSNNNKLSSCSSEQIYPVLEAKAIDTDGCFVALSDEICGNRVVEGSEECDCGWADECDEGCCNPQSDNPTATPCTKSSTAVCSPSQGSCCDSSCQYKSDTESCRAASDCLDEALCAGDSATCPASSQKPNATTCGSSDNFLVCYNGECSGSICLAHGREPCYCSPDSPGSWKDEKLCQVCCKDGDTCKSSYELDDIPDAEALAGQPCNDFFGYCDVFKICRQVKTEGPLSNLNKLFLSGEALNAVKEFLTEHWYIGLIAGVVFILSIALVVKFCSKSRKYTDENIAHRTVANNRPNQVAPTGYM